MVINDERLMAFADGELSPDDLAEVERAIALDPALAAKVAQLTESRAAMKRAFGTAASVPESLSAAILAMAEADAARRAAPEPARNVVDLASRRRTVPFWQLPIAASIALAVGVLAGGFGKPGESDVGLEVAGIGDPALMEALATVKSGERTAIGDGADFLAIASFHDGEGQLCREFEHDRKGGETVVAVACRNDDAWSVRFAVAAAATDTEGYAPASSLDTLDSWLSAVEAGAPLSADEEAAALTRLR